MNLTQFFDASIKLQEYGYKIHSIDADDKTYSVEFTHHTDICSSAAYYHRIRYYVSFCKSSTQQIFIGRMVGGNLFGTIYSIDGADKAFDFIIADIQKIEEEEKQKERQKLLDKLTPKEREVLGI